AASGAAADITSVGSSASASTGALRSLDGSMMRGTAPRSLADAGRGGIPLGFAPPGIVGSGMLGIRGNGPAMLSTGVGACAAAAPGTIGIERVACDGAVLPGTDGIDRVPCDGPAAAAADGMDRVP